MRADDLILVSVDDHICEPADMFDAHVPAAYKDHAPRVITEHQLSGIVLLAVMLDRVTKAALARVNSASKV